MKNQELKSSLIKSGLLLTICVFFIYAFAVSDSGGVIGTIGSIFSGIVFLIGLAFALAFSIVVIIGIYFGILAMYSQEVCKKSYDQFKTTLSNSSGSFIGVFSSKCCSTTDSHQHAFEKDIADLRDQQNILNNQLTQIQSGVGSLEQSVNTLSSSVSGALGEITALDTKTITVAEELASMASVASVNESIAKLTGDISSIQNTIKPLTDKLTALESSISAQTKEDVHSVVDKAVGGLQEELTAIKDSVQILLGGNQNATDEKNSDHRILAYFPSKEDEEQFISLVEEAVSKEMTYAEIGELLNDSLSAENAEIIAEHPSLTKDFIRTCRQKD
ncbi:MAG: hypothetical protein KKD01_18055 [Proteobacteria bacterium]|nr:hypothetical protein [Pseudomonadota bacterium]MBU1232474.1 hypothetical protein [Pseudomonadota bacterium]MBU1419568.1 hypothetical protein [Pseudomonadota bacterium]MBU1456623.1 hypothetical protein [Pseudomonadota bacterium]